MSHRSELGHRVAVTVCAIVLAMGAGTAAAAGIRLAHDGLLWMAGVAGLGCVVLVMMALLAVLDWDAAY